MIHSNDGYKVFWCSEPNNVYVHSVVFHGTHEMLDGHTVSVTGLAFESGKTTGLVEAEVHMD